MTHASVSGFESGTLVLRRKGLVLQDQLGPSTREANGFTRLIRASMIMDDTTMFGCVGVTSREFR